MELRDNEEGLLSAAMRSEVRRPWAMIAFALAFPFPVAAIAGIVGDWFMWVGLVAALPVAMLLARRRYVRRHCVGVVLEEASTRNLVATVDPEGETAGPAEGIRAYFGRAERLVAFLAHIVEHLDRHAPTVDAAYVGGKDRLCTFDEFASQFSTREHQRPIAAFYRLNRGSELWCLPAGHMAVTLIAHGDEARALARSAIETHHC